MNILSNGKQQRAIVYRGFSVLPIMVYASYAVRYIAADRVPALQLVALFAMAMPALLALASIYLTRQSNITVSPDRWTAN
jgi:hypothetical protein